MAAAQDWISSVNLELQSQRKSTQLDFTFLISGTDHEPLWYASLTYDLHMFVGKGKNKTEAKNACCYDLYHYMKNNKTSLESYIEDLLAENSGKTAKEISQALNVKKKDVQNVLYDPKTPFIGSGTPPRWSIDRSPWCDFESPKGRLLYVTDTEHQRDVSNTARVLLFIEPGTHRKPFVDGNVWGIPLASPEERCMVSEILRHTVHLQVHSVFLRTSIERFKTIEACLEVLKIKVNRW